MAFERRRISDWHGIDLDGPRLATIGQTDKGIRDQAKRKDELPLEPE